MSVLLKAETTTKAWFEGIKYLRDQDDWREFNVVLDVANPMSLPAEDKRVSQIIGTFLKKNDKKPLSTVINTIFPACLNDGQGADALIQEYMTIKPTLLNHQDNRKWGTYFMRIAARTMADGTEVSPLSNMIQRIRKQRQARSPKRAWYELNLTEPCFEIPIYDNLSDPRHLMGGPCLSHLSFKLKGDDLLTLTALYRSHYYIERTLGNLYGLALLQDFVAKETGLAVGHLVCHSTMAQIDHNGCGKAEMKALLDRCGREFQTD